MIVSKPDSVNVRKKATCSKETMEISIYINLALSYQKTMKTVTRNNNTQNVREAMLVCDKREDLNKYWANATCNL